MTARSILQKSLDRPFAVTLADTQLGTLVGADEGEILGQHDQAGSGGGGLSDKAVGLGEIGGHVGAGNHLDGGDAAGLAACHGNVLAELGCRLGIHGDGTATGRAASFSTLGSDQPPVTAYSKLNSFSTGSRRAFWTR